MKIANKTCFGILSNFYHLHVHLTDAKSDRVFVFVFFLLLFGFTHIIDEIQDTDVGDVEQLLSPLPVHETIMADVSRVLSTGVDPGFFFRFCF